LAVGIRVDVKPLFKPNKVPFSAPKAVYSSYEIAQIAAKNIV